MLFEDMDIKNGRVVVKDTSLEDTNKVRRFWNKAGEQKKRVVYNSGNPNWNGRKGTVVGCLRGDQGPGNPWVSVLFDTKPDGSKMASSVLWEAPAGNLKIVNDSLPSINFQGLEIVIENPVGSIRQGKKEDGTEFKTKFLYPYGYIANAIKDGDDGDEIDVFVGPNEGSAKVFIIHQRTQYDKYDELKVMLGFDTEESARDAYLAHYDTQDLLGHIKEMSIQDFKSFVGIESTLDVSGGDSEFRKDFRYSYQTNAGGKSHILSLQDSREIKRLLDFV
jgi:hypothetical protein